jgi:hypothetical protein
MTNHNSYSPFEEDIRNSFGLPEIRPQFKDQLHSQIITKMAQESASPRKLHAIKPAWKFALGGLALLIAVVLIIGPGQVYAQLQKLFGYVPGVGLVEENSAIRVLAEPVSQTRDGVTITVTSGTLTIDQSNIDYRIFGVPDSAFSRQEATPGCKERPYLLLSDGSQLLQEDLGFGYPPIPSQINEAVFVIPCITDTLSGAAPENWELPLRFVPAPSDLTVMPVVEITPEIQTATLPVNEQTDQPDQSITNFAKAQVDKIIQTDDGFILIGSLHPTNPDGRPIHVTGVPIIEDSNGNWIFYQVSEDMRDQQAQRLEDGGLTWVMQFNNSGVAFPVTITFPGTITEPNETDIYNGESQIWQVTWQPDTLPSQSEGADLVCINQSNLTDLDALPEYVTGKVTTIIGRTSILLSNLDGSDSREVARGYTAALSPDGSHLASQGDGGITLTNLEDGKSITVSGAYSPTLAWSPDGKQLAVVAQSPIPGIIVLGLDGNEVANVVTSGGEVLAGWSSNSTKVYYGLLDAGGSGYLLRSVEVAGGKVENVFLLEKSPGKNPGLTISPDGKWIAYRGDKQATLYIKGMDGSPARLVMDAPMQFVSPAAILSFAWSTDSRYLGIAVLLPESNSQITVLLDPVSCAHYKLENISGDIQGVIIQK